MVKIDNPTKIRNNRPPDFFVMDLPVTKTGMNQTLSSDPLSLGLSPRGAVKKAHKISMLPNTLHPFLSI